jgi:uncharacterized protein (DUF4415 family)
MMQKDKYSKAPVEVDHALDQAVRIPDFLPPPNELVEKREKEKITILLDKSNVDFFRQAASEQGVRYQTMINSLLSEYVRMHSA